jgi:lysophospholipase L1-like esterase
MRTCQRKAELLLSLFATLGLSVSVLGQQVPAADEHLQWIRPNDPRLRWINVADWEQSVGGSQPVRVPEVWRAKFPPATASRALSAAGMAVRFRTDSQKVILRFRFIDAPERLGITPEMAWELSRPPYFDVYRDGKFLANVPGKIHFYQQDLVLFDGSGEPPRESEFTILLPHYYRNAEIMINAIGVQDHAQILAPAPDRRPMVLFHGDSITHGHGVTTPRETWVWQSCEIADCQPLNLGFGGSAWTDTVVAEYIASRSDWDALVLMLGTNSFGGTDGARKPETLEQYEKKYDTFLATVRARYPSKPILCITPILSHGDVVGAKNRNGDLPQAYRDAIQRVVEQRQKTDRNLYFLDGLKLVDNTIDLLPTDQIHPNMAGSMRMAEGVAAALKPILAGLKSSSAMRSR